jgi:hypothetical protein
VIGAGPATAVLGSPDGTLDPNTAQYVDVGGGDLSAAWAVTLGFATAFGDVAGVDVRVFTTQLNATEGFNVYAGASQAGPFTLMATFTAFTAGNPGLATVDIDFNGTALPAGASTCVSSARRFRSTASQGDSISTRWVCSQRS